MGMREDVDLANQLGLEGNPELIEAYARLIRMEFCEMIREEYKTWHGSYQPVVKVALEHLLMRFDPDATLK